jgi:PAS domain S-box-containing protein
MEDREKNKEQLIEELNDLRKEIAQLKDEKQGKLSPEYPRGSFQELHDLFDNANDLIQSVNARGEFLYVNKKWREILGYSMEEVAELDIFDIVHPDSQEHCRDTFERIMSGEKVSLVEADFISKKGKRISVEGNVNCRFEKGKPIATRAIFRDITEKRKKEAGEIIKGGSEHLKVAELIQICNFFVPEDSVITVTNRKGEMGEIYIAKGRILHASTGKARGKKALFRMLGWEAGVYAINQKTLGVPPTIDEPLEKYLLDGARELDEFNNLKRGVEKAGQRLEIQYSDELMKRQYDPITAEVLSLAIKYKDLKHILDKSKYTDLETLKAIVGLLQKGILRAP